MQLTKQDVKAFKALVTSSEFKRIVTHCRRPRTILGILQEAFHEIVLTRFLRFFCDTSESHGLRDTFVREWLKAIPKSPFVLSKAKCKIDAHFNWLAKANSGTNRYVDLVLVISQKGTRAIIGVETKIDAVESEKQLEDYQRALSKSFNSVRNKYLFYLTPDGKANRTGSKLSECQCFDISYNTIIIASKKILMTIRNLVGPDATRTRTLLTDLAQFLDGDVMKNQQQVKIEQMVRKLEDNEDTSRALDILKSLKHQTTIRSFVYEQLLPRIRQAFKDVEVEWHYPNGSVRPREFNFAHSDINKALPKKARYKLLYMLYSAADRPDAGDTVSVYLMVHSGRADKKVGQLCERSTNLSSFLRQRETIGSGGLGYVCGRAPRIRWETSMWKTRSKFFNYTREPYSRRNLSFSSL
jgi:hypothetical protein